MKCFFHQKAGLDAEACAKIGRSKGNIPRAILSLGSCWEKTEIYLCANCYDQTQNGWSESDILECLSLIKKCGRKHAK